MTQPKQLSGSSSVVFAEEAREPFTFDFSGGGDLHIMSCMPVQIESSFWRKVVPVGEPA